jgi:magnesium chelatase subunit D
VSGLPFSAVVGQDDARLALLLGAVDPGLGGVLLTGEKGTAKTTLVRALTGILPGISVVAKCRFSCDPAAPDPGCPDGPHSPGAAAGHRPARLVELPLGATDDRVTGSLDVPRVLAGAPTAEAFVPGLLAQAHRGVLYVDEINLLPDHLVDVMLDAAATGTTTVEREGISLRHASQFLLVGTMNPEEGELRPQLLDRFGLCVPVVASGDPRRRADAVRARLRHDRDPAVSTAAHDAAGHELTSRIAAARALASGVELADSELLRITRACAALGVDGLRGDLVTARAAIAHAAWAGRSTVTVADVKAAARLALPHRRRRGPFDDPGLDDAQLDEAFGSADDPGPDDSGPDDSGPDGSGPDGSGPDGSGPASPPGSAPPEGPLPSEAPPSSETPPPSDDSTSSSSSDLPPSSESMSSPPASPPSEGTSEGRPGPGLGQSALTLAPGAAFSLRHLEATGVGRASGGRRSRSQGPGGRPAGAVTDPSRPDLTATVRAAALARPGQPFQVTAADLRRWRRRGRESNLVILLLDTSGSMAARRRSATVTAVALSLLRDSYRRRDRVALLTFRGREATVVVPPTRSVELASRRLSRLPVGGQTPLAAGLDAVAELIRREHWREPARRPLLVIVTDGRATGGRDALDRARQSARRLAGVSSVVVDAEEGPVRLGLAGLIAGDLGAELATVAGLASASPGRRDNAAHVLAAIIRAKEAA